MEYIHYDTDCIIITSKKNMCINNNIIFQVKLIYLKYVSQNFMKINKAKHYWNHK